MQVLILDGDAVRQAALVQALRARGLQVLVAESVAMAEAMVRAGLPDLLVMAERVSGKLSHSVALLAGCGAAPVPAVFISERQGEAAAELFELIPSAVSLAGPGTRPETLADIAASALGGGPLTESVLAGGGRVVPVAARSRPDESEVARAAPVRDVASRAERARALARLPELRPALTLV